MGSESVTSIVSAAELDELFAWMSPHSPELTWDQLEHDLMMHGHPTIVVGFDPVSGRTVTVPA
ncbi:hypothetical protein, partial [Frankia sp. AvcI1]|uniref:hypothetical protein n=1 Tax=Frankia sp. AvcI1 TaxID=573496 RepID=UPI001F48D895